MKKQPVHSREVAHVLSICRFADTVILWFSGMVNYRQKKMPAFAGKSKNQITFGDGND